MNDQGTQAESEFIFKRLVETFKVPGFSKEIDGYYWLPIMGVVLFIGMALVVWMYIKDSRTVRWYWAVPLAALRICVYAVLAIMFLMPARQGYERVEKRSRVLIVIDVSESMAKVSDDNSTKTTTRLAKVMDFLSDEKVAFLKDLLDRNPVYIYRFGNRLDEDAQLVVKGDAGETVPVHKVARANGATEPVNGVAWQSEEMRAFAAYDFKPWVLRGLSGDGIAKVKASAVWDGNAVGNADWAAKWLETKEAVPTDLNPDDAAALESHRAKLPGRIEVARSIGTGTNAPDSLLSLINRETGNMVQGVIVFSDGQSNLGSEAGLQDLKVRAEREKIPILTVAIGSEQRTIAVRITDLQAPEQTPPDEGFKIIVEQDGEGLVGKKATISLEVQLPKGEPPVFIPMEATYQPGEPPHAQAEFVLDPTNEKFPEALRNRENPKEMAEGDWKVRAVTPRVEGERFNEKEHVSEWVTIKVQKKAARVLIICSAPNRDVQFLLTQLLRDKADVSLLVQNDGGTEGKINLLEEKERQLTRFPDHVNVETVNTEDVGTKWYNIASYDVIVSFDFDWSQLTVDQTRMVQNWVDLQAGGLLFVAGHIFTKHLARPDADDKFKPIIDILPVIPGDPDLAAAKRTANIPWRLEFENLGGDLDFMKLDDTHMNVQTGWELFFTGREDRDDKARMLRGFYNYFPLRSMKSVATPIARFPDPNAIKMPDGKAPPWLCVMQYGQGRTAWVGSPEIWRLRQYKDEYFERFWTKFTRYLAAGSRRKQSTRGRVLMSANVASGGYMRPQAKLLTPSMQPADEKFEPNITFRPLELDKYPAEMDKLTGGALEAAKAKLLERFTHSFKMSAKKGLPWEGYFQRTQLASAEKYPPGNWRVEVEIPSSTETLKYKFQIRQSNPELDQTRPNFKEMYSMASKATDFVVSDKSANDNLQKALAVNGSGPEGKRLAFRFGDDESLKAIPPCFITDTKTARNKGKVEDYWDKGIRLPSFLTSWLTDDPEKRRLSFGLLLVIGLLSVEWLTRKLLKLA